MALNPKLLNDGESIVVSTRTHAKALIVPVVVLLATLAVASWADLKFAGGAGAWIVWVVAVLVVGWFSVRPFLDWVSASYTITDRRLITRSGVFARRGHDIPLARISDVAYEMGLVDRMLGCGTLIISDASTMGRVLLHDIPQVEQVQRTLNELLHDVHRPGADEGA